MMQVLTKARMEEVTLPLIEGHKEEEEEEDDDNDESQSRSQAATAR